MTDDSPLKAGTVTHGRHSAPALAVTAYDDTNAGNGDSGWRSDFDEGPRHLADEVPNRAHDPKRVIGTINKPLVFSTGVSMNAPITHYPPTHAAGGNSKNHDRHLRDMKEAGKGH